MAKYLVSIFAFFIATLAFGQDAPLPFPIPEVDPLTALLDLIKNWQASTPLAIGMALVVFFVQVLKSFAGSFKYTRLAVTFFSVAYGVLLAVASGQGWLSAVIATVVVGGGAVAIYEAWKGVANAVTPAKD